MMWSNTSTFLHSTSTAMSESSWIDMDRLPHEQVDVVLAGRDANRMMRTLGRMQFHYCLLSLWSSILRFLPMQLRFRRLDVSFYSWKMSTECTMESAIRWQT